MRRFDPEYRQAARSSSRRATPGTCCCCAACTATRRCPDNYTQDMLINDSVVHEFDVIPWLAGADIAICRGRYAQTQRPESGALREPILVLMELDNGVLVDVEMNVSVRFGYQVATEAVFQRGVARIGQPQGMQLWQQGQFQIEENPASRPASGRRTTSRCSRGWTQPGSAPSKGRPPGTATESPSPARPGCRP